MGLKGIGTVFFFYFFYLKAVLFQKCPPVKYSSKIVNSFYIIHFPENHYVNDSTKLAKLSY